MAENNNTPVEFKNDDFILVQENSKIFDKKFETKPTTFLKDAFKRFVKNKSSVVAAIILAILILLALIVPVVSKANIEVPNSAEKFLAPKLFKAGTGFWDGTRKFQHIVYDTVNEVPAVSDKYSVDTIKSALISINPATEPESVDVVSPYGHGGSVVIETEVETASEENNVFMYSQPVDFTAADNFVVEIVFSSDTKISEGDETETTPEEGEEPEPEEEEEFNGVSAPGQFRVYLKGVGDDETEIIIRDFSKDYSTINFNISEALAEAGLSDFRGTINFEVKAANGARQFVLVKSLKLTVNDDVKDKIAAKDADNNDVTLGDYLEGISFDDATAMVLITKRTAGKAIDNVGYWACTGRKGIHAASVYYCDYVIDTYMLAYGKADPVTYSKADLDRWIEAGWCTYDSKVGIESFVKLSDECPIDEVVSQRTNKITGKLLEIEGTGWKYHKMGYSEMPKFILGTDVSGFDLFKRAFAGLRTSLLLGVITAAFCFAFGLVWGSISGYFGGSVDLAMERFCELLGGVPWIVIMTLAILHLGNNFGTFILALCLTGWMGTAARTRTQFYRFKGREYVLASRTLGSSDMRLIFKHILPNSMGTIITSSVLMVPSVIFSEATLAYLHLGLQGKQSFGIMMANNQQFLGVYPYLVIFPAVIMALIMISFNLFGNGLRDAFNPSLKGSD